MDLAEIDEEGKGLLFFGETKVEQISAVKGQNNVFLLKTSVVLERENQLEPKAGQFFLIRSKKTNTIRSGTKIFPIEIATSTLLFLMLLA